MRRAAALAGALILASCKPAAKAPETTANPVCRTERFEDATFVDCVASRTDGELRIVATDADGTPLRTFAALQDALGVEAGRVRFAMNAGMFDDAGRPIGLFITAGQLVRPLNRNTGPGNFHLLPNGVFSVEPDGFHIRTTDRYAEMRGDVPLYASQSGPMLVIDGQFHPKIAPNGASRNIRNGVGVDRQGRAHFVIADDPVSFGTFARFFRDRKDCPDALFFDGTVSSLWEPGSGRMDDAVPLGPMVVALAPEH